MLSKNDILGAKDIKIELVDVPEWGGSVYVKEMTGAERDKYESSILEIKGDRQTVNLQNARAKLASYTICDENGNRLFTETDISALASKSATALQRIFEKGMSLSKIGKDDMDSLTKN